MPATAAPSKQPLPEPEPKPLPEPPAPEPVSDLLPEPAAPALPPTPPPTLRSENGRLELTADRLTISGQSFSLLELEGVDVQPVRWLLWFMLGGLVLAGFTLAFLQNWLRTMPAMLGMATGALVLAYGNRGSNRIRLHRLGREALYFSFAGASEQWLRLAAEANRRIRQRHDEAAARLQAELDAANAAAAAAAADYDSANSDEPFPGS